MELRISRRQFGRAATAIFALGASRQDPASAQSERGWRELTTSGPSPAARWDHTIAAHDGGKQLIVFGGRDSAGTALADLWTFSRSRETWTQHEQPGPAARFGHAIATVQDADLMYLFGGQSADVFYNDLWSLDLNSMTWALIHDGSGQAPSQRYGTSLVPTSNGQLIVSHGFTFQGRFDDTWAFDLETSAWIDRTPAAEDARPLKRCLHEAVWSPESEQMLLYGGCSSGFGPCPQGDFWAFDPNSNQWTELAIAPSPPARSNPGLVFDSGRNQLFLFGGLTEAGYDNALFAILPDGTNVTGDLAGGNPPPPSRASHDLAMTGPHLYLFGGNSDSGPLSDLWTLDVRQLER